ncbi:MAG: hypothetical protein JWN75_97 [Candidatus Saccharibacteria bacterium]|nr:hypothetical protein [Candidatus Saccharibacteria bacterium]
MPHDDVDDVNTETEKRLALKWYEMPWDKVREADRFRLSFEQRRKVREVIDLNIQAAERRANRNPKWSQLLTLAHENPLLVALGLLFAPITVTVVLYLYLRKQKSP